MSLGPTLSVLKKIPFPPGLQTSQSRVHAITFQSEPHKTIVTQSALARFIEVEPIWASHNSWFAGQQRTYPAIDAAVLWFVESGSLEASTAGQALRVEAGQICWQPPKHPRHLRALQAAEWKSIALRIRWFSQTGLWREIGPRILPASPEERRLLESSLRQLIEGKAASTLVTVLQRGGCAQWIAGFCLEKLGGPAEAAQLWPDWLSVALRELESNPDIEINSLAGRVGYSPTQFRLRFREYIGKSPGQFADECRVERARQLLASTDWPVSRIARELQFGEATHFTRFFKRHFGTTPRRFRASLEAHRSENIDRESR